jgi:hypothetical protein
LVQQQQETQSHANPNTTLAFSPASITKAVGDSVNFDVVLSPGGNQVNFVKLAIKFDPTKLEANEQSFVVDPVSNLSVVQGPTLENGTLTVVLSVQNDPTKVIQSNTKIGSVAFTTLSASDVPTQVSFDPTQIQIRSINSSNNDAFNENVFLNGAPASVTIQGELSPTSGPTEAPTEAPTAEPTEAPVPTDVSGTPEAGLAPVCDSLTPDVSTGEAPFSVNFTVTGNETSGSVSKVTFNYGDGNTEDVTTGGGLGTDTVSLTQAHTYASAGSFTASALLTDDGGATSDSTSCTQTITVSAGGSASDSATITPLAATGPSTKIVGLGAIGGMLFLIGALLFLAL